MIPLLLLLLIKDTLATLRLSDYNSSFVGYPDVMLLGVQKGGTTSLYYLLVKILKLYVNSGKKEAHFFSFNFNDDAFNNYITGFDEMRSLDGDLPTFDGSPSYFDIPKAWDNIKSLYSPECLRQKKFILSLREPVAREVSWFHHYFGNGLRFNDASADQNRHLTFHERVQSITRWSGIGNYLQNIKNALKVIHRDQLFIVSFETLTGAEEQDTINRLLYFLGARPVYTRDPFFPKRNTAEDHCGEFCDKPELHEIFCSDLRILNETYSKFNEGLLEFINSAPDRPPSEPQFQPFSERLSEKCIGDDGKMMDFN